VLEFEINKCFSSNFQTENPPRPPGRWQRITGNNTMNISLWTAGGRNVAPDPQDVALNYTREFIEHITLSSLEKNNMGRVFWIVHWRVSLNKQCEAPPYLSECWISQSLYPQGTRQRNWLSSQGDGAGPGQGWPDGGRCSTGGKWTQRRAATAHAPIPDLNRLLNGWVLKMPTRQSICFLRCSNI